MDSQDSEMFDESNPQSIEIILKPMNITEIHKRDVKLPVEKDKFVGDFA